ncbi:TPA: fimbrial protein [Salmonella enterica]|uniref:chaperone-usher fimbrial major subunit n=1 Tax=Salmonella enterica TaxID=28901 RepID=UPI00128746B3|nr:chaperone-usher fimbrial major subunit [Salmonella enterica]ECA8972704.1 fimbrial protein [Salmonella enterica subsp. enterica serovar Omuna]ECE0505029.1 fimbrial protein [Salmonella enterica subsp. enterica]EDS6040902.1 fimbrial protein [Salmonella enterica subsp. enterica serovar Lexington]EEB9698182.1 fimbrial protein [Salmonella enterica subsp. enterica serovar Miami]EEJ7236139.1 fimbrial protein [Salmonella enterica subsp. salamae]
MKLNMIAGTLALSSVFMAGSVMAADGTVHFRGEVVDSTCEVTPETRDQVVDLGKVNRTTFANVGDLAAPTQFSIDLQECPETYKTATVRFDGVEDEHGDGNLKIGTPIDNSGDAAAGINPSNNSGDYTGTEPTAIAAGGVAIRLFNRADNSPLGLYNDSTPATISNGTASMKFIARYVSTIKDVTPGTANADSQFTVEYQK